MKKLKFHTSNFHFRTKYCNGIAVKIEHRNKLDRKIWYHLEISFLQKLFNQEARRRRDRRFQDRKSLIKVRPKIRLISIEWWEMNSGPKKPVKLKTKGHIRIEICLPGYIYSPPEDALRSSPSSRDALDSLSA